MRAKVSARQSCLAGTGIQPRLHRMIPAAMIAVIAALLSSGGLLMWVQITNSEPAAPLAAAAVWSLCLAVSLSVLRLHPLSPAMVYLYVFGVFHLGLAVPWSMGLDVGPAPAWLLHSSLDPALTLIILALMAYLAGTSLAAWKWPVSERATPVDVRYHNVVIFHCGLVIFLGGLAMFLWGLRSLGFDRLLSATYFETYKLTNWYDPRFFVTSLNVAPIGLYLMAAAAPWRRIVAVLLTVLVWSSVIFWLGFRGFGLIPVITVLAVIHKRGFRLPKLAYPAGIAVMLFAIPLITVLRDARLEDRSIPEAASELRPLAAVSEMGASLRPLVHTVHYMETEDFRWGQTYWRGLLAVFPNVSGDWEGGSYLPLEELPPSHWVTKQAAPWSYAHFGGLGFSAVAEPYMNFGTAGVVLYFIALPAFLVWADRVDASRPTRLATWAVLLGPLLWTTRNSFDNFFRPALLGLLCVFLARLAANSLASIRRRTSDVLASTIAHVGTEPQAETWGQVRKARRSFNRGSQSPPTQLSLGGKY